MCSWKSYRPVQEVIIQLMVRLFVLFFLFFFCFFGIFCFWGGVGVELLFLNHRLLICTIWYVWRFGRKWCDSPRILKTMLSDKRQSLWSVLITTGDNISDYICFSQFLFSYIKVSCFHFRAWPATHLTQWLWLRLSSIFEIWYILCVTTMIRFYAQMTWMVQKVAASVWFLVCTSAVQWLCHKSDNGKQSQKVHWLIWWEFC